MARKKPRIATVPTCSAPPHTSDVPFGWDLNAQIRLGDNDNDPSKPIEFRVGSTNTGQMSWGVQSGDVESGNVGVQLSLAEGGGPNAVCLTVGSTSIWDGTEYGDIDTLYVQVMAAEGIDCLIE